MFDGIFIASLIGSCIGAIKDAFEPAIPAENWANKELYHKDIMNGVSDEERMKNVKNGKYKLANTYPEPHRDPVSGKIVIENGLLYNEDIMKYSASQVCKWVEQGRYNLTPEEYEKEKERIKKKYENMCK